MPAHKIPLEKRFWSKVDIKDSDECWIWQGVVKPDGMGYGICRIGGNSNDKKEYAHRISFFLDKGRWPFPGMVVMHVCDTPKCVNPSHLIEGSQAENVLDAKAKGRLAYGERNSMAREEVRKKQRGEKNPMAKLSDEQSNQLFELKNQGYSQARIAREFNVSPALISLIINRKRRGKES
jgi:hypothetical protein